LEVNLGRLRQLIGDRGNGHRFSQFCSVRVFVPGTLRSTLDYSATLESGPADAFRFAIVRRKGHPGSTLRSTLDYTPECESRARSDNRSVLQPGAAHRMVAL
jgi:hypothetical protein